MDMQRGPMRERRGCVGEQGQFGIEALGRRRETRIDDPVAAADPRLVDRGEIQCAALSRMADVGRAMLRMEAAHAHRLVRGGETQGVAGTHAAAEYGAGDDGAVTREREDAIDRETEQAVVAARLPSARRLAQCGIERGDARIARDVRLRFEYRRAASAGGASKASISARTVSRRAASARSTLVIATAPCVTPSSWRIARCSRVCGMTPSSAATTSSGEIDAARAGRHRMDEAFVPGHVDDAEHVAVGKRGVRIAEFDRDAAGLLFLETVGVDAGQRVYQRGPCHDRYDRRVPMIMRRGSSRFEPAELRDEAASSAASRQRRSSRSAWSAMRPITGRGSARSACSSRSRTRPPALPSARRTTRPGTRAADRRARRRCRSG